MTSPSTATSAAPAIQKGLAVLGTGKMGGILIDAFLRRSLVAPEKVHATVHHLTPDRKPATTATIALGADNRAAAHGADVVLLCVKPMQVGTVLDEIKSELSAETVVISIAASVTTDYIEKRIGANVPVIRAMPNTPSMVGEGITAISKGKHATEKHVAIAKALFDAGYKVTVVSPAYPVDELRNMCTGVEYIEAKYRAATHDVIGRLQDRHNRKANLVGALDRRL